MNKEIIKIIRNAFSEHEAYIPLHVPNFSEQDKKTLQDCIESTYVSSVGEYVDRFENMVATYTGSNYAVATMNGTSALHLALILAGVEREDLVITQPLSFIATANAISYLGAQPLFVDIDPSTLGLSADKLQDFLHKSSEVRKDGKCYHLSTGKKISACVPMHTFGHPVEITAIMDICKVNGIQLIEDAAEAIGSFSKGQHVGTFGDLGIFSFNGNKIITCGGGGMITTNNERTAEKAKHLTTQAKVPHKWEFRHDHIGFNYRLPNLNAALGCSQLDQLNSFLINKAELAAHYSTAFSDLPVAFFEGPIADRPNHWLNALLFNDRTERDAFLEESNSAGVMTRPSWELTQTLDMYKDCIVENIGNAELVHATLVNIPSSVRP